MTHLIVKEEPKENNPIDPSFPKDSSSPSIVYRVHKPATSLPPFP